MSDIILMTVPSLAELIISILFINKLYKREKKLERLYVFIFTLALILLCKTYISYPIVISVISLITLFLALKIYTKESYKDVLLGYILLTIFTVLLVQIPTIPFISMLQNNRWFLIIHSSIFLAWGVFLVLILPLDKFYAIIKRQSSHTYLVLADCGILTLFVMWYLQIQRTYYFETIILYVFFSIVILFINLEIYISNLRLDEQKKRIKIYEEYLPILDEMILAVRKRQHNYDNKIQAIQALPNTCNTFEELASRLSDPTLKQQFSSLPTYLLKTNLTIVAGYIYKKSVDAAKKDKHINVTLTDKDLPTVLPQYELIDLLGILIDNALEAIPESSQIDLLIDTSATNKIVITTKNQGPFVTSELIKKMFSPGYSSKHTGSEVTRGLGLSYLKDYVDKHNGEISVSNETIDGVNNIVFRVEV